MLSPYRDMININGIPTCFPGYLFYIILLLGQLNTITTALKLDMEVSGFIDLIVGDDCILVVPNLSAIGRLAHGPDQFNFLHTNLKGDSVFSHCISPSDIQEGLEYESFESSIKNAVIGFYTDGPVGMIQLECLDMQEGLVVSYAWKSKYKGDFWQSKPLVLRESKGSSMLKFKALISAAARAERAKRKSIPLRNEILKGSSALVARESFEAYQYCYEMFLRRNLLISKLESFTPK